MSFQKLLLVSFQLSYWVVVVFFFQGSLGNFPKVFRGSLFVQNPFFFNLYLFLSFTFPDPSLSALHHKICNFQGTGDNMGLGMV